MPRIANLSGPLELTQTQKNDLAKKYTELVNHALNNRSSLEARWKKDDELIAAEAVQKDTPWPNACGLVVPLIPTFAENLESRLLESYWGQDPFVSIAGTNEESIRWAKRVENLLQYQFWIESQLLMPLHLNTMGTVRRGTGILSTMWRREPYRQSVRWRPVEVPEENPMVTGQMFKQEYRPLESPNPGFRTNAAISTNVKLENMVFPPDVSTRDPNEMPWVCEILTYRFDELYRYFGSWEKRAVDYIKAERDQELGDKKYNVAYKDEFRVFLVWAYEDINGDGKEEDILLYLYPDHQTAGEGVRPWPLYLKGTQNPLFLGGRPYQIFNIMPKDETPYGDSYPKILESLNDEVTTIHRLRMDAWSIAVARMFKYKRNVFNPDVNKIFPGAGIPVDEMDDVQLFETGEVKMSSYNEEAIVQKFMEMRGGIGSSQTGRESPTDPRAPGIKTMALIREANIKVSAFLRLLSVPLSQMVRHYLNLDSQYFEPVKEYAIFGGSDEGVFKENQTVESIQREALELSYHYSFTAVSMMSKEVDRQLDLFYYETLLKNPAFLACAQKGDWSGIIDITEDTMRTWNKKNIDKICGKLREVLGPQKQQQPGMPGMEGQMGGGQNPFAGLFAGGANPPGGPGGS